MSSHERAHETPGNDEAAAAASSEPEVVDAEVVEEVVVDGVAGAEGEGHVAEAEVEVEVLEADPLADALRERAEYLELAQRTRADFENYKRRAATQAQEAEQRGRAAIARNLLPAIDNLQRALAAAGVDPADGDHADGMTKGFVLVYGELRSALERSGVNAFDPAGAKFDPMVHEAVSTAPAENVESGIVIETLELGYKVDEQVIRPARVVVSG